MKMMEANKTELLKELNELMKKLLEIDNLKNLPEKYRVLLQRIYTMIQHHKNIRTIMTCNSQI